MADRRGVDAQYYGSRQSSVINNNFPSSRRGRIGAPTPAAPAPNNNADPHNTDKFYREGGVPARTLRRPGTLGGQPPVPLQPSNVLAVIAAEDVKPVLQAAIGQLQAGMDVVISVTTLQLQKDMITQFDLAVARTQVTAEQLQRVRFSLNPVKAPRRLAKVDANYAAAVPAAKEKNPVPDDMRAFVMGEDADVKPQMQTEIPVIAAAPAPLPLAAMAPASMPIPVAYPPAGVLRKRSTGHDDSD